MTFLSSASSIKRSFLTNIFLLVIFLSLGSCTVPALTNADNYGRAHEVYAVDFNPEDLSKLSIAKMDEGTWKEVGSFKNSPSARYNVEIKGDYLIVTTNKNPMDVPTYKTWLDYAREELGYDQNDAYDIFETVEEGWIYEINLKKHPLVNTEDHRLLMYERK
ncbi:MAG TPA: hypothetical protein VIM94_04350 [Salegentibacter sp.]|uniref:hypothetical protein n=1 Tax=Salegentibacter sp. TaxID=1903072 RepID=UPI002F93B5AA